MAVLVVVEGVNVVAADVCAEAVESVGLAVADVAAWLALVDSAVTLPVAEMDSAAGAPAAWMMNKVSPTAAVVTVLRRAEVRETGISRILPITITVLHEGRYRCGMEDVPSSVELRWRPDDHQAAFTVSS
jgi:CelD/BcsL family acetyltransferase involved in cellulose biosynthesis